MNGDASAQKSSQKGSSTPGSPTEVGKLRHELHGSITHILGFSEIWVEELREEGNSALKQGFDLITEAARQMMAQINESLPPAKVEPALAQVLSLKTQLSEKSSQIVAAAADLAHDPRALADETLKSDLARITASARHLQDLAVNALPGLTVSTPAPVSGTKPGATVAEPANDHNSSSEDPVERRDGVILVVDDQEENRELLSRRLSRLGYAVHTAGSGQAALELVGEKDVDLILLDILMPGLDGIEVLHRLKANPRTRHIPVVMLSSADQIDMVVRCVHLGADDFLPKPFNPTLLMARIESSLSKKRLRDQETAFLQRLQAEQDISEKLLLNILPTPIAKRLKQGENNIADSFPEVTVLFSDFVDFTKLSTGIPPKVLVGRLNEIFSAFDQLCERHGLEKIKMIGDAYMAVCGLPTARADHAAAAADLALAMQADAARFRAGGGLAFDLRIGLNSGPVVAGVIGTKKFAYDLWGDTVNIASRMEQHAPTGGILVTDATYQLLKRKYVFKAGQMISVKGKGEVLTHLLVGKGPGGA